METKTLKTALDILDKYSMPSSNIGILGDAYLDPAGLRSTDMETVAHYAFETGISTSCLLNIRQAKAAVKGTKAAAVAVTPADGHINIDRVSIPAKHEAADFPQAPEYEPTSTITAPAAALLDALTRVLPAASTDETRPALTRVLFEVTGRTLMLITCDSYRLHTCTVGLTSATEDTRFLINAAALRPLVKMAKKLPADDIELSTDGVRSRVVWGPLSLITAYAEPTGFPAWRSLMRDESEQMLTIDRDAILADMDAIKPMIPRGRYSKHPPVRLDYNGNAHIDVTYQADRDAATFADSIACYTEGEPLIIGLNPAFLRDAVAAIEGTHVGIGCMGPMKPVLLQDTRTRVLLMPVRID